MEYKYPAGNSARDYRVFDKRNRHYYGGLKPDKADYKNKVVAEFADHINNCLLAHGRKLTPEALGKLCDYTGEIIDNAEEHAGMFDWTIQGYLDNNCAIPLCEIAIFNFGVTIAESLNELPRNSYTWKQISPYINNHKLKKFFGPDWSELDLLTVIALQGHVSSKNNTAQDTRGNGTVELIEFFQKMHKECSTNEAASTAKMAIISGGTYILFDGTHKLIEQKSGAKTVTFNKQNSLEDLPDAKYVRGLKGLHFPGTIISIKFPLGATSTIDKGDKNVG